MTSYALLAAPMHGQTKLSREGYRTRDGHLIEWFGSLLEGRGPVAVLSRPDPWILRPGRENLPNVANNTIAVERRVARIPNLRDRKRWWLDSARYYKLPGEETVPAIVWNPFVFRAFRQGGSERTIVLDLLDDWSIHHAFEGIRPEVEAAYREAFDRADAIYANSEGTAALAQRYGRHDVVLMPNGTDPERFSPISVATGMTRVGYLGKIGKRVDLELVLATAKAMPQAQFVFAGPILDREYHQPLRDAENIELLGDVHYSEVPALLQTFDIGWVPHSVGTGEVGGDAIKIYEYHAAGLPVVSTPIIGAGKRGLAGVTVVPAREHVATLAGLISAGPRVPRLIPNVPEELTWRWKARAMLQSLGLGEAL